jgi:hypothetical protein
VAGGVDKESAAEWPYVCRLVHGKSLCPLVYIDPHLRPLSKGGCAFVHLDEEPRRRDEKGTHQHGRAALQPILCFGMERSGPRGEVWDIIGCWE